MSISIYIKRDGQPDESRLGCGYSAARDYWDPAIAYLGLEWLEVAFSGGIIVTPENYSDVLAEVTNILAKFNEMFSSATDPADVVPRCTMLRDTLLQFPPGSGYKLYLG